MPYMVLDITKKPGDPNAVKTGDMLLSENTKMREALEKVVEIANREWDAHRETSALWDIHEICTAALNECAEREGGAK